MLPLVNLCQILAVLMYIENSSCFSPFAPDLPNGPEECDYMKDHQLSTTELLLGLANEIPPLALWKGAEKDRPV